METEHPPFTLNACLWSMLLVLEQIHTAISTGIPVGGQSQMRLVPFTDGTKDVWVNPTGVFSLEEAGATRTKIHMSDGVTYTVDGAHGEIATALATDTE